MFYGPGLRLPVTATRGQYLTKLQLCKISRNECRNSRRKPRINMQTRHRPGSSHLGLKIHTHAHSQSHLTTHTHCWLWVWFSSIEECVYSVNCVPSAHWLCCKWNSSFMDQTSRRGKRSTRYHVQSREDSVNILMNRRDTRRTCKPNTTDLLTWGSNPEPSYFDVKVSLTCKIIIIFLKGF